MQRSLDHPISHLHRVVTLLFVWAFSLLSVASANGQAPLNMVWVYSQINTPNAIAYSPDGKLEVVGGVSGVQIYDSSTGTLTRCLPTSAWTSVASVAFSPDGSTLAIGGVGTSGVVELWSTSTWMKVGALNTSAIAINSVAFSPDGSMIVDGGTSATSMGIVELWGVSTQGLIASLGTAANSVSSVAFSPDGSKLAVGGIATSGVLELWNPLTAKLISSLPTAATAVMTVQFSPNGTILGDGGTNGGTQGVLELWNPSTRARISSLNVGALSVSSIAFSPDGKKIVDCGSSPSYQYTGGFEIWDVATGNNLAQPPTTYYDSIAAVTFSKDGKSIAEVGVEVTGSPVNGVLESWDLNGNVLSTIRTNPASSIYDIAFSPDGKKVAVVGVQQDQDGDTGTTVQLRDALTGAVVQTFNANLTVASSVAFSPDGAQLAIVGWVDSAASPSQGIFQLWDIASGSLVGSYSTGTSAPLASVAFSSDGKTIAFGGCSFVNSPLTGLVYLWSLPNSQVIASLPTNTTGVNAVAFSPDGSLLAVGGSNSNPVAGTSVSVVELWNAAQRTLATTFSPADSLTNCLSFAPDGRSIAVGGNVTDSGGNNLRAVAGIWSVPNGKFLTSLAVPPGAISSAAVAISPDANVVFLADVPNVQAFSLANGALVSSYSQYTGGAATGISVSPDGGLLAFAGGGNILVAANPYFVDPLSGFGILPGSLVGGAGAIGTVTLTKPAPPGGEVVLLTSSNKAIAVPSSTTVPGGSLSAQFTVSTSPVSSNTTATITATSSTSTKTASLTVVPASLLSVSTGGQSITGGHSATCVVSLDGPAATGGAVISLSSSSSSVIIPATVTIPSGQTSITFTIQTAEVTKQQVTTISAAFGTATKFTTLTLLPPALLSVDFNPSTVVGGNTVTGVLTLTGLAETGDSLVKLSSSSKEALVPLTASIQLGLTQTTFSVKTLTVETPTLATISATLNGVTVSTILTIIPPTLKSLVLIPSQVVGMNPSGGSVSLTGPAPSGGITVVLSSNQTSAVVPTSVKVPAGAKIGSFTIKTSAVPKETIANVSANLGATTQAAKLTIEPPTVKSLTLSPTTVKGGKPTTGTITIGSASPSGGLSISVSVSGSAATAPATVTIPSGKTSASFLVKTSVVNSKTVSTITAKFGGTAKTATLTIQ